MSGRWAGSRWLLCAAAWAGLACQRDPVESPTGISLHVRFQTRQGTALRGGWVESAQGRQVAHTGDLELIVPFASQGQHIVAKCPLLFSGDNQARQFSASTLSAGGRMEMTVECRPMQQAWGLSVHSECPGAELLLNDRSLGKLRDGWLHVWLTQDELGPEPPAQERWLRLVARADATCKFIDPVTRRRQSEVELTLALASSTQAMWAHFPGVAQPPSMRRGAKKPPRRPYRL